MEDDLDKIEAIFGKVTEVEAYFDVVATLKRYPRMTKVFIPNSPYQKKVHFMEARKADDVSADAWVSRDIDLNAEDNLERSLRKTKTLITDYVLCNEFELFATFTFSPKKTKDRFNPEVVKMQMANWLKNQRTRNGKFSYLIVPEFHKDGKALHFHALMKNYTGELIDIGRNHRGRKLYHFKSYTLGFNSAVEIDDDDEDVDKVSSYVKKYITKDMPQFRGKRRFWTSHGLARPQFEDNPPKWYLDVPPQRVYENEYGRTLYFLNSSIPASQVDSLTEDSTKPPISGLSG
ncbi:MAG: hypothetical protein AAB436_00340 [Patescibacteria group bacterium]